jgi:hypothetical protein
MGSLGKIMKSLSFKKIISWVLIYLTIQPIFGQETSNILSDTDNGGNYAASSGKEKQQSFSFVYGVGISNISFDISNNLSEDGSGHQLATNAIQLDNQGVQTRINVTAGANGSLGTANDYNRILGYSTTNEDMTHILQLMPASDALAHKPTVASNQNFWLSGKLKINGQAVKGNIVLGHNSDKTGNWWIGDVDGTRYDSPSNSGINLVGETDGQAYCINDSQSNYQAVVTTGVCTDYSASQGNIIASTITFSYATKAVNSVTFTPELIANKEAYVSKDGVGNALPYGGIASGSSYWYYNNKITIPAGANGSFGTASDFNNLLGSDVNSQMLHSLELTDRRQSDAHQLALAQNMNFWIKGTLSINGNVVSDNFILGHNGTSDHNWWVGSPDGARYDSVSNSGLNVKYIDEHSQTHAFCLNQSKNNYSLAVSDGVCTSKTYDDKRYHGHWRWVGTVIGLTVLVAVTAVVCVASDTEEYCPKFIKSLRRGTLEAGNEEGFTSDEEEVHQEGLASEEEIKGSRDLISGVDFTVTSGGKIEAYYPDGRQVIWLEE